MATKILCDACGKEIKYGTDRVYCITIRTTLATIRTTLASVGATASANKAYDFCEDCYNELMKHSFKEKGENDENPNS